MTIGKILLLCGAASGVSLLLSSSGVLADTAPATPETSVTAAPTTYDKIADQVMLNYFGIYRGASVSDIGSSVQPDEKGNPDPKSPQSVESYVNAGYRLTKDLAFGVSTHFFYFPVGSPVGTGQDMQMLDPSLMLTRTNLVNTGGLKIKGTLYLTPRMTNADTLAKYSELFSVSPTFVISYDVPKTRLNLSLYTYLQGYVPGPAATADARSFRYVLAPNAAYSLTDSLQATVWFDFLSVKRQAGTAFFAGMYNDTMDIEPGINWDINKYISINPILNIYPSQLTLAATSLQAVIIAKAF